MIDAPSRPVTIREDRARMLLRLKMYRLLLKATTYALPFLAWEIGWRVWALCMIAADRPVLYPHRGHFALVLFSSFVWAFMAEHYKVTNVDELFRERTGAKAAWSAGLDLCGFSWRFVFRAQ